MSGLRKKLEGYKTYLLTLIAIVTAMVAWMEGASTGPETIAAIFAALFASTLRDGMNTTKGDKP